MINPVVAWAQRSNATDEAKNIVYLSIAVQDPVNVKLDYTATTLKFSAQSSDGSTQYELNLEFYDKIDPEETHKHEVGNQISLVLRKKTLGAKFWPRLLKDSAKFHYIKTDFNKWVDEDEQEEVPEGDDMANMMGGMPGMGGMGGMGGMDMSLLMGGMGGAGGDFDVSKLAAQMGLGVDADLAGDDEDDAGDDEDDDEDDKE